MYSPPMGTAAAIYFISLCNVCLHAHQQKHFKISWKRMVHREESILGNLWWWHLWWSVDWVDAATVTITES